MYIGLLAAAMTVEGGGDDGAIMSGKTGRGRTLLFHPREAV